MAKDKKKPGSKGRKLPKIRLGAKKVNPEKNEEELKTPTPPDAAINPKSQTTRIKLPPDLTTKAPIKPKRIQDASDDFPQPVDDEKVREAAKNATARILIDEDSVAADEPVPITAAAAKEKALQVDLAATDEESEKSQTIKIDLNDLDEGAASQTLEISFDEVDSGASQTLEIAFDDVDTTTSQTIEIAMGDDTDKGGTLEINPEDVLKTEEKEKVILTPKAIKAPPRTGIASEKKSETTRIKLDLDGKSQTGRIRAKDISQTQSTESDETAQGKEQQSASDAKPEKPAP